MKRNMIKNVANLIFGIAFMSILLAPLLLTADKDWNIVKGLFEPEEGQSFKEHLEKSVQSYATYDFAMDTSALLHYELFHESIAENVFIGKGEQFFYAGCDAVDDLLGTHRVAPERLQLICEYQQSIKNKLEEKGVRYLIVVAPNKERIYPENLQASLSKQIGVAGPSRKEQILSALAQNTDVEVLDLTDTLLEAKKQYKVYMDTDNHWNYEGSYAAYCEMIRYLRQTWPDLPMVSREQLEITHVNKGGKNLSMNARLHEKVEERDIPMMEMREGMSCYPVDADYEDPGKMGTPADMILLQNDNNEGLPNVMVIGDSFTGWSKIYQGSFYESEWDINYFMGESFHRYVRYHYLDNPLNLSLVSRENSDLVIRFFLEGNLELLAEGYVES